MKAQPAFVRRLGIGLAVATTLLVSACAAGQQAQTAETKPTLDGVNATLGNIGIRGLAIDAPSAATPYHPIGSDVAVQLVLVNTGVTADRLTSISSPAASGWAAFATAAEATSTTLPPPLSSVPLTAHARVSYGVPDAKGALLLVHLTKALYPGTTVPLTFTFADAGTITVDVPVALSASPHTSIVPELTQTNGAG